VTRTKKQTPAFVRITDTEQKFFFKQDYHAILHG